MQDVTVNQIDTHVTNTHLDNAAERPNAINEVEKTNNTYEQNLNDISMLVVDQTSKRPVSKSWKDKQEIKATKQEIERELYENPNGGIAYVTGAVSGNLEVIDVDSKYKKDAGDLLFDKVKAERPDLFSKLRINNTQSGGYHILYRIDSFKPDGNQKLASRYATDNEVLKSLSEGLKRPSKYIAFLETRGEGGYILSESCKGYSVYQDVSIPLISINDRNYLINACRYFNEVVNEVEKRPKISNRVISNYSVNPFEDYDLRCDEVALMERNGWKLKRESSQWIHFIRPGKNIGVSASFNKEKRYFYNFTSSTELDPSKGYLPATLYTLFEHNGDSTAAYHTLRHAGYGKYTKRIEDKKVELYSKNDKNIDPLIAHREDEINLIRTTRNEKYPFGVPFAINEKGKVEIDIYTVIEILNNMGFSDDKGSLILINENNGFIKNIHASKELNEMREALLNYISEDSGELDREIRTAIDEKLSTKEKYIRAKIKSFDKSRLLRDTRESVYKVYNNGIVEITANEVEFHPHEWLLEADRLVHESDILKRDYIPGANTSSLYKDFLVNSTTFDDNVKNIIGYLAYNLKIKNSAHLIVLTEKVPDPKLGGGSGKNVFVSMLGNITSLCEVDGVSAKVDETILQAWNNERLFHLSDVGKHFPFARTKALVTDDVTIKKLYKNLVAASFFDTPKLLITTNYALIEGDGGVTRRARQIEFTDFYTRNGGVDAVHGKLFPDDFTTEDWAGFDSVMIECIQYHLKQGCKIEKIELSNSGKHKQFTQLYGEAFIEEFIEYVDELLESFEEGKEQIELFAHHMDSRVKDIVERTKSSYYLFQNFSTQQKNALFFYFFENKGFQFFANAGKRNAPGYIEKKYYNRVFRVNI